MPVHADAVVPHRGRLNPTKSGRERQAGAAVDGQGSSVLGRYRGLCVNWSAERALGPCPKKLAELSWAAVFSGLRMRQSRGSAPLWVPRPPRACRRCPRRAYSDIASAGAEAGGQVLAAAGPTFAPVGRLSRFGMAVAWGVGSRNCWMCLCIEIGPWWLGKGFPVAMVVEKVGFLRRGQNFNEGQNLAIRTPKTHGVRCRESTSSWRGTNRAS